MTRSGPTYETSTREGYDWRDDAECIREDVELFFPIGNTGGSLLQIEEALTVCGRCQVVEDCREFALKAREPHGIWGGMTEDDRKQYHRRVTRAAAAERRAAEEQEVEA